MNDIAKIGGKPVESAEELVEPVTIGPEAYISEEYARAEVEKLWRKTWLQAGRLEDIPNVGDFITFDIVNDSFIVIRSAPDKVQAFYNVCSHRGRRLVDTPAGKRNARGTRKNFICGFHGWRYDVTGKCTLVPEKEDWQGVLTEERTHLGEVKCDTWGGWIWISMNPEIEPLRQYLEPIATYLDPFELQNMRPRWRRWLVFDCNWKVALEAFNETYHVETTHPEFMRFGQYRGWARAQGRHSNIGYDIPKGGGSEQDQAKLRLGSGGDLRLKTAEMQIYTWEQVNTNTTWTLVQAAQRLKDELPADTPPAEISKHWLDSARRDDEKRGVFWPTPDPKHVAQSGTACQIFPNFHIGHAVNNMLCYNARPYGTDPNKCYFEAAVYELYPEGEAPETEWEFIPEHDPRWGSVLPQDFSNMAAVQAGMRNGGFRGTLPNPYTERTTANLHRNLSWYMGAGAPRHVK
jgi:phenylpropionate dioxygenase-like ring-hydroxylating dioxygenase large terminal subunit